MFLKNVYVSERTLFFQAKRDKGTGTIRTMAGGRGQEEHREEGICIQSGMGWNASFSGPDSDACPCVCTSPVELPMLSPIPVRRHRRAASSDSESPLDSPSLSRGTSVSSDVSLSSACPSPNNRAFLGQLRGDFLVLGSPSGLSHQSRAQSALGSRSPLEFEHTQRFLAADLRRRVQRAQEAHDDAVTAKCWGRSLSDHSDQETVTTDATPGRLITARLARMFNKKKSGEKSGLNKEEDTSNRRLDFNSRTP